MSDALVVENVAIGSLAPVQVESVRGIDLPVVRLSDACFKHGDAENRYAVNSAFSLPASDEGIATVDSGPRTAVPAERGPPAGALHAVLHDNAGSGLKLENCVMDEKELASPLVLNSESEVVQRDTAEHGTEGSLPKVKTACAAAVPRDDGRLVSGSIWDPAARNLSTLKPAAVVECDSEVVQKDVLGEQDLCRDGLYCSATGVWRPYELVSETGLVSAVEDKVALIRFKTGSVRRVKRALLVEYDGELVGKAVDKGVWDALRPGEAVKEAKKAKEKKQREKEAMEGEEKASKLQGLYVRWAMLVGLGLLNEDLDEDAVQERMRCKKRWEFWFGEYQRRVLEAGGQEQFMRWLVFNQGILRQEFRREVRPSKAHWEKEERRLLREEAQRQRDFEKEREAVRLQRQGWRLEVKAEGEMWQRVDAVRWACEPRLSRALASRLGLEQKEQMMQLRVRAVQHGVGQSGLQLWCFSVVEDESEWIEVKGKGLEVVKGQPEGSRHQAVIPSTKAEEPESATGLKGRGAAAHDSAPLKAEAPESATVCGVGDGLFRCGGKRDRAPEGEELGRLWLQCPVSLQWIRYDGVHRGSAPSISKFAVGELGVEAVDGRVLLQVRTEEGQLGQAVWFEVREEAEPDVCWSGEAVWRMVQLRKPGGDVGSRWEGELEWLQLGSSGEEGFWRQKEREALERANEQGEAGGSFEGKEAQPNGEVLGPWLKLGEEPEGHAYEYTRETDSPEWLRSKESVFVAGGMVLKPEMYEKWKAAGADREILSWIKQGGYEVKVSEDGARGIFKKNGKIARENGTALALLVCELLLKETWELVAEKKLREGGNILPLNLAPKPSKEPPWRIICNAIDLNFFCNTWRVRYESLKSLGVMLRDPESDWLFSIDLEDAYYSMLLKDDATRGLFGAKVEMPAELMQKLRDAGLVHEGLGLGVSGGESVCIQPRGLPMGFTNSCAIWTKISRVLTRMWRERGWRVCGYIDDFLFVASSEEEAWKMLKQALRDIEALGLAPSYKKTIQPTRRLKFLGILVDARLQRFFVPGEKIEKIQLLAKAVAERDVVTMRELASVAGKVMSVSIAIPAVRLLTRECYNLVRPDRESEGYDASVPVSEEVRGELLELCEWIQVWNRKGAPIRRRVGMQEVRVIADAGTG